jgi:hypothetical protein
MVVLLSKSLSHGGAENEHRFQDDCAIQPRPQFSKAADRAHFFTDSTHMTIGAYHHWDIARRLRKDLSQRVTLYDEEISQRKQVQPLEEQRLLFGGRQLEYRFSPPLIIKAVSSQCRKTSSPVHSLLTVRLLLRMRAKHRCSQYK